jgi:hypothetical protein
LDGKAKYDFQTPLTQGIGYTLRVNGKFVDFIILPISPPKSENLRFVQIENKFIPKDTIPGRKLYIVGYPLGAFKPKVTITKLFSWVQEADSFIRTNQVHQVVLADRYLWSQIQALSSN